RLHDAFAKLERSITGERDSAYRVALVEQQRGFGGHRLRLAGARASDCEGMPGVQRHLALFRVQFREECVHAASFSAGWDSTSCRAAGSTGFFASVLVWMPRSVRRMNCARSRTSFLIWYSL